MCGIFAIFGPHDHTKTLDFFKKIWHRGPDSQRLERIQPGVTLGFARLAIQDPHHRAMQPFSDPKRLDTTFLYNGEIYSLSKEMTKINRTTQLDGEFLLHAIVNNKLDQIGGKYAAILLDKKSKNDPQTITVIRDRIGVRSLFYSTSPDGHYAFASEPQALPWPQNVKMFPPACTMTATIHAKTGFLQNISWTQYFPSTARPMKLPSNTSITFWRKTFMLKLTQAVKFRTDSLDSNSVGLGCLLSGGLDSTIVTALTAKQLGPDSTLPVWTVAMKDINGVERGTDLPVARQVSSWLNRPGSKCAKIMHTVVGVTPKAALERYIQMPGLLHSSDPTTCRASAMMSLLMEGVSQTKTLKTIKCIMSGEGADELLFGYTDVLAAPNSNLREYKNALRKWRIKRVDELCFYDVLRSEIVVSRYSFEGRFPFLDKSFKDFVMSMPLELLAPGAGIEDLQDSIPEVKLYFDNLKSGVCSKLTKSFMRGAIMTEIPGLLTPEILMRPKEALSDAPSDSHASFHAMIQKQLKSKMPEVERLALEKLRPKKIQEFVKHTWTPEFTKSKATSARDWGGAVADTFTPRLLDLVLRCGYSVTQADAMVRQNCVQEAIPDAPLKPKIPDHAPENWVLSLVNFTNSLIPELEIYYPNIPYGTFSSRSWPKVETYKGLNNTTIELWCLQLLDITLAVEYDCHKNILSLKWLLDKSAFQILQSSKYAPDLKNTVMKNFLMPRKIEEETKLDDRLPIDAGVE